MPSSPALQKTVVLIGLMGAGKTTVGRRLARRLGVAFQDSDDAIEEAAGCTIADMFEIHGESVFRDLEQRVIARLLTDGEPQILATGGGAWMNRDIREQVRRHAVSIWLKADIDVLVERVERRNHRPLLEKGDKRAILARLMEERYPVYAKADLAIQSDDGLHEKVVETLISLLKQRHLL